MTRRIKDIIATLGAMVKFFLSFEYQNLIIYIECKVSVSEAEFQIKCKWNSIEFTEQMSYSYIEDTYKQRHPYHYMELDTNLEVVNYVLNIVREKIGEKVSEIYHSM